MTRLLLVDDDHDLTDLIAEYLEQEGFDVEAVHDGAEGARAALAGDYALVVLDGMLPRLDGQEVLRRIRARSSVPVLMLTGRGDDACRIEGLEAGADDYVTKPCSPRELTARVRSILRRLKPELPVLAPQRVLRTGELVMWPEQRRACWRSQDLSLTPTEFSLLEVLAEATGRVVSREELSRRALGREVGPYDRNIDVHLSAIRHKLGPAADGQPWIRAIRGLGYQFVRLH